MLESIDVQNRNDQDKSIRAKARYPGRLTVYSKPASTLSTRGFSRPLCPI